MNEETKNQEPQTVDPAAGTGAYFTPKAAINAIMANPPLGDLPPGIDGVEPRDTPLSPDAPQMVPSEVKRNLPRRKEKFVVEIGGVEFVREVMGNATIFYHGAYTTPGGHNPKHFTMEVWRSETGKMHAVAYNTNGNTVMNISGNVAFKVFDRMACNALGGYVRYALKPSRIHRSARRTAKAAAAAPGTKHEAPSTKHEEEVAS